MASPIVCCVCLMPDALLRRRRPSAGYLRQLPHHHRRRCLIVPTLRQEENDARALALVAKAFPGYDIIGINFAHYRSSAWIYPISFTMQYPAECQLAK